MLSTLFTFADTQCSILKGLYNNAATGTSCCKRPSQPWCEPLKAIDLAGIHQVVYDAPNFDAAMSQLERVATVWNGASVPYRITHYNTPVPYDSLYLLNANNITEAQLVEYRMIFGSAMHVFGANATHTAFNVLPQNGVTGEGASIILMTVDNKGRVVEIKGLSQRDPVTAEIVRRGNVHESYSSVTPTPEGVLPMTSMPEKLRSAIINYPTNPVADPVTTPSAVATVTDIEAVLGANVPNTRNLLYQTDDVFILVMMFMTTLPNDGGIARDEDILATNLQPGPVKLKALTSRDEFKAMINAFRVVLKYDPVEWGA